MKIFVYGTLKKDFNNHHILEGVKSKFLAKATSTKKFPMFILNEPFPYLQDNIGVGNFIKGEVFEVDDKHEERLDDFEGVPYLYKKGLIEVQSDIGMVIVANCYFKGRDVSLKDLELLSNYKG